MVVRYVIGAGGGAGRILGSQPVPRDSTGGFMSAREQLNSYIGQVERRLRWGTAARGAAILTVAALVTTVVLVLIANSFGFSNASIAGARTVLVLALLSAGVYGIALPLLYLDRPTAVDTAEGA